jgi:hypothetical protein
MMTCAVSKFEPCHVTESGVKFVSPKKFKVFGLLDRKIKKNPNVLKFIDLSQLKGECVGLSK